jgi:hypothetical protein
MTSNIDFEPIRSYTDEEFPEVRDRLISEGILSFIVPKVFPDYSTEEFAGFFKQINSVADFQARVIYPAVKHILKHTSDGFTYTGLENLEKGKPYLFISNHRDIVLDPTLLNFALFEAGFNTAEVAIGDNLIHTKWIEDLVRINKSFIVRRSLNSRELVLASKVLSEYVRYSIREKSNSIWIAQRQGRAKDGNDKTQAGILNMILMACEQNQRDYLSSLNIVPVSVSYEKDPCDSDKVNELYQQVYSGGYQKREGEDVESMKKGLLGDKGKIHIHFSRSLSNDISDLEGDLHKNDLIEKICDLIDLDILNNYKLYQRNYMAYDLYFEDAIYRDKYTWSDRDNFIHHVENNIKSIPGLNSDHFSIFYKMYAQPLINKLQLGLTT